MDRFVNIVDRTSNTFGLVAGILMIIGVVLVILEIIIRTVFNSSLYITSEYTGYLMVGMTFFGLAYTLKEKGHIRMVFLHKFIDGGKARIFLDMYACAVGLILFAFITYATFTFFLDSATLQTRSMSISKTYLAIPQFAMPLGSFLLTMQFASEILKSIKKLKTGDMADDLESDNLGR